MVFSSFVFLLLFLPVVLVMYFLCPKNGRNYVLLLVSLIFYGWGEPVYVFLMIGSIIVAYFLGIWLDKSITAGKTAMARAIVAIAVVVFMGTMSVFKIGYSFWGWALPIGISFFSFQILSYIIDVYRGTTSVQKNPFYLGTYVALFPQLIAGPIVRYETIAAELENRKETVDDFGAGVSRFVNGLAKKVIIANSVGYIFAQIQQLPVEEISTVTAWISAIAYTFQIYFDFSGYSDMAIGLGRMFGFKFLENFKYPYVSKSITEFWRNWHISLSSWFRDYVYIPLGGNRCSKVRHIFNLFVVWALTGLWHGFGWNFLAWGLYYFVLLMIEKFFIGKKLAGLPKIFQHIYTMFFVIMGWLLFSIEDWGRFVSLFKAMFGFAGGGFADTTAVYYIVNYAGLLIVAAIVSTPVLRKIGKKLQKRSPLYRNILVPVGIWVMLILSMACLAGESFNPFLYFRF